MGGYESKEFDRLQRRKFRPYSLGHRKMYLKAIDVIAKSHPEGARIFEAGFGIGYGLQEMLKANVVGEYCGLEPNKDSYDYVAHTARDGIPRLGLGTLPNVELINSEFSQHVADRLTTAGVAPYDEAFCIEVIEHVPMDQHLQFLIALKQMAPRLWLSTPDSKKSKEGVRTMRDWSVLLRQAQFENIVVDQTEWTYLYRCE
jgi:hypothetical protein